MTSQRLDFIDIAKGIGILIVICSHSKYNELMKFAGAFFIPLFFILSGYTYSYKNKLYENIIKKIRRLLIPYFFSNTILLSILTLLGKSSCVFFIGIFYSRFYIFPHGNAILHWWCAPTWFLTALFIAFILVLQTRGRKKAEIICIPIFILITYGLSYLPILLPWSIDTSFLFASYILTGKLIKRYSVNCNNWILVLLISFTYMIITHYNGHINYSIRSLGNNIIFTFISGLLGSLLVIWISHKLESTILRKPLVALGKNSLLVFCFHIPIISFFDLLMEPLIIDNKPVIYIFAVCSIILTAIIGYYLAQILYLLFPFLR